MRMEILTQKERVKHPRLEFDYDKVPPKPATEPPLPTSDAAQNHVPNPYINSNLTHEKIAAVRAKATNPIVKGFMVGRTLWVDASTRWFKGEINDAELVQAVARNFAVLVDAWQGRHTASRAAA